ncbi:unnamed protein product [Adineta steineri]|uniref:F-box domain-containing protein n=3 Tax=Adineta steineri TaxID=433720 RepID=A0A815GEQ5_9BILA|nr:unnamed protein product [Adineta steineri]CAF3694333.1 unnamed protein product [Adineta steineri]
MESSFLLTLPVEIVHRILDCLNIQDIIFSFRYVCKKFYSITNIYNRLKVELSNHSSDTRIHRLYRIISPENVRTLILRNSYYNNELNDIDYFFSFNDIHRFTGLRFVRLDSLTEKDFCTVIHHLTTLSTFKSLSIFDRRILKNDTIMLLSNVIALQSIRELDFDISTRVLNEISWPNHGMYRKMNLKLCSYKQWCHILHHSPNLRIASITKLEMNNIAKDVACNTYKQLTSLTLNCIQCPIDQVEMLLASYPSLISINLTLNIISSFANLQRFSQWEYFIGEKLPRLKTVRFRISTRISRSQDFANIKSIIAAFRTPFWLQYKCWYMHFKYVINNEGAQFIINSSIDGYVNLYQEFETGLISYFTSTRKDDDGPKMHNVWSAIINLPEVTQAICSRRFTIPKYYLFDNVIQLGLDIDHFDDWQRSSSFECLSKLINLSQLKEIYFLLSCKATFQASKINTILEKAINVRTFGIKNNGSLRDHTENQCAAISPQIEHFIIRSPDTCAMKVIAEHVEHISTITFSCDWSSSTTWKKIIKWLMEKEKKFSVTDDYRSIRIWMKDTIDI